MPDNFLPNFQPIVNQWPANTLHCLVRDRAVCATPEELVRQRVLHWLINNRGWAKDNLRLERSYAWVSDPNRTRIRPDLELIGDAHETLVVVECKRGDVPLNESVNRQAIEYAIKSGARWIWTTNGESHGFLQKKRNSRWTQVDALGPLDVFSHPPASKLEFPANVTDAAAVRRYWRSLAEADSQFDEAGDFDRQFVLAVHRVLFGIKRGRLPYSCDGVHILEGRGSAWHKFDNAGGGAYHTQYADFIAATQGCVQAVSLGINRWQPTGLRLCVGLRKQNRNHHALQLDAGQCIYDVRKKSWQIYHGGSMANVRTATVMDAVKEAGAEHWIGKDEDARHRIYLGSLRAAKDANWSNSRMLLANLIHYGIIRSNLREAVSAAR